MWAKVMLGRYTWGMDSVRIGKALGIGTRVFGKAVSNAVAPSAESGSAPVRTAVARPTIEQRAATTMDAARNVTRAGESFWRQLRRISGVVMLETVGLLFAFVALFMAQGLWKHAADVHQPVNSKAFEMYVVNILVTTVFGYFTVSSFVRAERRAKGKKPGNRKSKA
jgi:hypothetical protein